MHSSRVISVRKRDLAIRLQSITQHPKPKLEFEQYTVPSDFAAEMLFHACYIRGDIEEKSVVDLGTGTGRLALGAKMLGASCVVGIDVDPEPLRIAISNGKRLRLQVEWVLGDIYSLRGAFDTVLMNPPFGTRVPHSDIKFLEVAVELGKVTYTIHKSSTHQYISRWLKERNLGFETVMSTGMEIAHQFPFHKKRRHFVDVEVLRIGGTMGNHT